MTDIKVPAHIMRTDTALGPLYIDVLPADVNRYREVGRGTDVERMRPALAVCTDTLFGRGSQEAERAWTVRGRAYSVHYHLYRDEALAYGPWHRRDYQPIWGRFRNDRGTQVEIQTKTWGLMWDTLTDALDAFDREHPGWRDVSVYLRHQTEMEGAMERMKSAMREVQQHRQEVEAARGLRDAVSVPAALSHLLRD